MEGIPGTEPSLGNPPSPFSVSAGPLSGFANLARIAGTSTEAPSTIALSTRMSFSKRDIRSTDTKTRSATTSESASSTHEIPVNSSDSSDGHDAFSIENSPGSAASARARTFERIIAASLREKRRTAATEATTSAAPARASASALRGASERINEVLYACRSSYSRMLPLVFGSRTPLERRPDGEMKGPPRLGRIVIRQPVRHISAQRSDDRVEPETRPHCVLDIVRSHVIGRRPDLSSVDEPRPADLPVDGKPQLDRSLELYVSAERRSRLVERSELAPLEAPHRARAARRRNASQGRSDADDPRGSATPPASRPATHRVPHAEEPHVHLRRRLDPKVVVLGELRRRRPLQVDSEIVPARRDDGVVGVVALPGKSEGREKTVLFVDRLARRSLFGHVDVREDDSPPRRVSEATTRRRERRRPPLSSPRSSPRSRAGHPPSRRAGFAGAPPRATTPRTRSAGEAWTALIPAEAPRPPPNKLRWVHRNATSRFVSVQ